MCGGTRTGDDGVVAGSASVCREVTLELIHDVRWLDPHAPRLRRGAVRIDGDRIVECLDVADAEAAARRADMARVDGRGAVLVPGFVDAHLHLVAFALRALRCDLSAARGADDVVDRLRRHADRTDPALPVVGVDWDESRWSDPAPLTRAHLDAVSHERPVLARRVCGHAGVANGVLLARLAAPGRVDRESGRLTEAAVFEASRVTSPPDDALAAAIPGAVDALRRLGVTAFGDIVEPERIDAWVEGLRRCRVAPRVDALLCVPAARYPKLARRIARAPGARAIGTKHFADGSIGARTAALDVPYADGPGRGDLLLDAVTIEREARAALEGGFVCAVHAIGDRAVRTVAEAFAAAVAAAGPGRPGGGAAWRGCGGRVSLRIEHAELVDDRALDAMRRAGAAAVMQPNFVVAWGGPGGLYARRLGPQRWGGHNPFRRLVDAGVPVVFSSDAMPAGPLTGLPGALAHPVPGSRLSLEEALAAYTRAASVFDGDPAAGRLVPGARADLVLVEGLDGDDPAGARVAGVWVMGRRVV